MLYLTRKIVAELVLSPRTNQVGISKPLKEAINILKGYSNLILEHHAMGTNIECSDIDLLFDAIKECHNYLINKYPRVVTTIKIDERTDNPEHSISGKKRAIGVES